MRIIFPFFLTLFLFNFEVTAQILSTDEKVEILGLGGQSTTVINAAAEPDYTLEELEQANEIKKVGLKDEVIILVLKERARLSADEIKKLKDYQDKNYSIGIITKSVQEKSKFSIPEKLVNQSPVTIPQSQNSNGERLKKFGIPVDPNTGKITVEKNFEIKGTSKEAFVIRASDWGKMNSKQWLANNGNVSETLINAKLLLDLPPQTIMTTTKNTKSTTLSFNAVIKCRDNQYSYMLTDFIVEYKSEGQLITEKAEDLRTLEPDKFYSQLSLTVNEAIQKIKDKMTSVKSTNVNW